MKHIMAAAAIAAVCAMPAAADVSVSGQVEKPFRLSMADLQAMPPTSVTVSYAPKKHAPQHGTFKGVLLWTLLVRAGIIDGPAHDAHIRHAILVSGSDGYTALIALGEIDPEYEGKQVILAYDKDGAPIANAPKLIVPGDGEGGRNVFDVVRADVQ